MTTRLFIAMTIAAVAILAIGCIGMLRLSGAHTADKTKVAAREQGERETTKLDLPLKPTATFNVTRAHQSGVNVVPETAAIADRLHDSTTDPSEDLQCVEELIRFHTRAFESVPGGGENVDIIRILTGGNEKRLALIPPDHPALNDRGELVDRWGTPFHFHPVSREVLEIRSAGPDKQLWTEDDLELSETDTFITEYREPE